MEELKRQIRELFTEREIDEVSISTLPDIVDDIMYILDRETTNAFDRGRLAGRYEVEQLG